jgi:hypothetical protein
MNDRSLRVKGATNRVRTSEAIVVGIALFLGGCLILIGLMPDRVGKVPPPGVIWFGSSFDETTFEIRSMTRGTGVQDPFVAVAHLVPGTADSLAALRLSLNGTVVTVTPFAWNGSNEVWGFNPDPLAAPGLWTLDLIDSAGNTLASGSIEAQ